jgi:hypothetical protein
VASLSDIGAVNPVYLDRAAAAELGGFHLETESFVVLGDDFLAYSPIPSDTADIGHEEVGLALRFHEIEAMLARMQESIGHEIDMLIERKKRGHDLI